MDNMGPESSIGLDNNDVFDPLSYATELDFNNIMPAQSDTPSLSTSPFDGLDLGLFDDWQLGLPPSNSVPEEESEPQKRTRGNNDDEDPLLACWKSPLCPKQREDGERPDNCNGECAPFLFATPEAESPVDVKSEPRVTVDESLPASNSRKHKLSDKRPSPQRSSSAETPSPANSPSDPPRVNKSKGRVPHNEVEKKYRENVNAQLEALRRVVPAQNGIGGFDRVDIEDLPARQPSKAAVMSAATSYIKHLQNENRRLEKDLEEARRRSDALQRLSRCDDCNVLKLLRLKLHGSGPN